MWKYIYNYEFNSDMESFTYFYNYDLPDPSDDDNHMEEFQVISDIPDLDGSLYFTSAETVA